MTSQNRNDQETGSITPLTAETSEAPVLVDRNPRKVFRYGATSLIALAISELTLLALFGGLRVDALDAAFVANLAGTVPSYVLSRYWIWGDADRGRPARQAVLYWTVSLISMIVSSFLTDLLSADAPAHHRVLRVIIVGGGFIVVSFGLWIVKYIVYQLVIFKSPGQAPNEPVTISAASPIDDLLLPATGESPLAEDLA